MKTTLQQRLIRPEGTLTATARIIGVSLQDLSHFVRGENDKIGRARRKKIREWMVGQGYMKLRRRPDYWTCPLCQARRVRRKNVPQQVVALAPEGERNR